MEHSESDKTVCTTIPSKQTMQHFAGLFSEKADSNGHITIKDFQLLMQKVGKPLSKQDLARLCKLGVNDQFNVGHFMSFLTTEEIETDELYQIFRELDKNGDGKIGFSDLKMALGELGENIGDDEVTEMLNEAKLTKDGAITFSEFVKILTISTKDIIKLTENYVSN